MKNTRSIQQNSTEKFFDNFTMTINGEAVSGVTKFSVINPATEKVIAYAPDCSAKELDAVVDSAKRAFSGWANTPIEERRQLVSQIADVIEENIDDLARLLTLEQGKILSASKMELAAAIDWIRRTAKLDLPVEVKEVDGSVVTTYHLPLGVVAAIPAWNYPVSLSAMKIAPALLTGNTLVLKQSPFTSLTILKIGELTRSFLPPGVFNVISSSGGVGSKMTSHPGFNKISYTGSTETGRRIMEGVAPTLKHITLELGGNDSAIVLADVDIQQTAHTLFWCSFTNSGQICMATKRIYVHEDIYDAFVQEFLKLTQKIRVGNGLNEQEYLANGTSADGSSPRIFESTMLGPVSNKSQYDRVIELIRDCIKNNYEILSGGLPPDGQKGFFIPLTVVGNPPENSRIVQEEQFGPIIPIVKVKNTEDAIRRTNAIELGLGGSVWTADIDEGIAIAKRIESGTVWVNEAMHLAPEVPFAGRKQSGIGAEGGIIGLLEFTVPQSIWTKKQI